MPLVCPNCHCPIDATVTDGEPVVCPSCGSSFPPTSSPTVVWTPSASQRKLGRFELIDRVGTGAFGTVYKARDTELDRIVAIKLPRAVSLGDDRADHDRFFREGRSVARLRHPSIVSVYEVGECDGTPFLVQDFVEGMTLADSLTGEPLPARQAAELVATLADALQYAHDQGVVHRDVKPSNIMLEGRKGAAGNGAPATRYVPKLMDFGLARRDEGEVTVTMEGQVLGTPAYMSPEQARGEAHQVDGRSDIYSLGVILYQLLTRSLPFQGNPRLQMYQVLHQDPPPPRKRQPTLPRDLETICMKAMAKTPEERYQTAREFASDLRRFLKGEPIQARRVSPLERAVKWGRRRPAALALGGAAVLAVSLVAAGYLSWRTPRGAATTQIEYYASVVRRWGVLDGLGRLEESQVRHRYLSHKIYRRAGRVEKVEIVTGPGELSGTEIYSHLEFRHGRSAYIDDLREAVQEPECRYEYRYDERGQVTEEIASNAAGRILWVFHYTAQGETTCTGQFMDSRGFARPRAPSGAAYVSITRTPEGWDRDIHYRDRRGRPAPIHDGSYGLHVDYDAHGLPVLQTLLDAKDRPMRGKDGYATVRQEFDDLGQLREWAYLDVNGRAVPSASGIAIVRQTYDGNGNVIEQACLGCEGRPTLHRDGYARVTKTYDDHGNLTSWSLYGLDGRPTLHRRWRYAQSKFSVNERGLTVEQVYYDTEGRPTVTEPGVTKFTNTYDEQGNQTGYASFGLDGRPVLDHRFGVAKTVYRLDERGNRVNEEYYGVDGQPKRCNAGFAKITRVFDDQGRETEWAFFDVDGKPICLWDGYARGKRVYDREGHEVELDFFGVDGKPVTVKYGYARLTRVYDDRGNVIEEAYFGPEGKPALDQSGIARLTRNYDDAGELIDVHYFDAQGRSTRLNFIRDWLVLAALPIPAGQTTASVLTDVQIPREMCLRPRAGDTVTVGGTQLVWKRERAPEFFLDFNRVQGRLTEYAVAYAVCYLVAGRERNDLMLKVGSDDQVAVRLNGQEILHVARPRALTVDDDVLTNVHLRQGMNVLVLKVVNETRDWSACVRLTDANGKRVPDVKTTLEPR